MENYFQMNFTPQQVNEVSNLGLAHVGDCVYELLCRTYLCSRGDRTALRLHKDTVQMVKATTQAAFADLLQPHLTESEQEYYRRGKNTKPHGIPKAASRQEYAKATGLETLFGALYLQGQTERLMTLFQIITEGENNGI